MESSANWHYVVIYSVSLMNVKAAAARSAIDFGAKLSRLVIIVSIFDRWVDQSRRADRRLLHL
jgi:hypothetical protein